MNLFKSLGAWCSTFGLAVVLLGFSSGASADWVVQTTHWQHVTEGNVVRIGYSKTVPDYDKVLVVRKLATYWVKPVHGHGRIRVTVPVEFYLTSWDVKALERELERLGVKGKPKPVPKPRPGAGSVLSG